MGTEHDIEESLELTIPSITVKQFAEEQKPSVNVKPLCMVKIEDLLSIPFNEQTAKFTFNSYEIGLVMFGGKIETIFSDDTVFSFCVNDGTGKIQCFYKNKECAESLTGEMNKFMNSASVDYMVSSSDSEGEDFSGETEVDDDRSKAFARESEDMITDVLSWFNKEIVAVADEMGRKIGDIVHVSGQLLESDSERKVKVMDFRIVENELEHEDFLLEMEYLYRNRYCSECEVPLENLSEEK